MSLCVLSHSVLSNSAAPWTVTCQPSLSIEFHWSRLLEWSWQSDVLTKSVFLPYAIKAVSAKQNRTDSIKAFHPTCICSLGN